LFVIARRENTLDGGHCMLATMCQTRVKF